MPTEKGDCSGFSLAGQWAKPVLHGRISGQTFASHKLLRRASVSVWFCGSGSSRPGQLPRVQCRLALRQAELRTDCVGAVVPEPVVTEVLSCTYLIISISHCSNSAAFSCCAVWPCRPRTRDFFPFPIVSFFFPFPCLTAAFHHFSFLGRQ